jgi:hypothetical protein
MRGSLAEARSWNTKVCADKIPPTSWSANNVWAVASAPGFADKYASAILNNVERPGNDPSVISDEDILSAVQAVLAASDG